MADLDDFFAKKDKNKKTKKKVTAAEDITKLQDESNKQVDKPRKEKEKTTSSVVNVAKSAEVLYRAGELSLLLLSNYVLQDESEWKEIDEERDYTGLKVQALTIK